MKIFGFGKKKEEEKKEIVSVCPYCFESVNSGEILFRATRGEEERDELLTDYQMKLNGDASVELYEKPVIFPTDPETIILEEDENDAAIRVEHKTLGESSFKLCPCCHNDLPTMFGRVPLINISLIGNTSVGKSVYLMILSDHLDNHISKETSLSATWVGDDERHEALKSNIKQLESRTIPATNTETYDKPFIFQLRDSEKNIVLLSLYDIAGESSTKVKNLGFNGLREKQFKNSDAIFLFLEPKDYTNEAGETIKADDENDDPIATLTDLIDRETIKQDKTKIAAIIAKADVLYDDLHRIDPDTYDILFENSVKYNENDIMKVNKAASEFLKEHQNSNHQKLANSIDDPKFFAISSLGSDPEGGEIESGHNPTRILESLLWILDEKTGLKLEK